MVGNDDAEQQRAEAARSAGTVLQQLDEVGAPLRRRLREFQTLPELAVVLDVASRQGDRVRTIKHVHQMSLAHALQYRAATEMKVVHLIDAFEGLAGAGNGLAIYPIARSALELLAQVHNVNSRLTQATQNVSFENWLPAGEAFFKTLVRARFATSNDEHRQSLLAVGASRKVLEPLSVGSALKALSEEPTARDPLRRYDNLCDGVHHNLSASGAITAGSGVDFAAHNARGGIIAHASGAEMTVTAYEYPVAWKADVAVSQIGSDFVEDVRTTLYLLGGIPESPYSPAFLAESVGSTHGVASIQLPGNSRTLAPVSKSKVPRNLPCRCGSGQKHKHCCGT